MWTAVSSDACAMNTVYYTVYVCSHASDMDLRMAMVVRLCQCTTGSDWNILTIIGWIAVIVIDNISY